jgi:hypothetical protein
MTGGPGRHGWAAPGPWVGPGGGKGWRKRAGGRQK